MSEDFNEDEIDQELMEALKKEIKTEFKQREDKDVIEDPKIQKDIRIATKLHMKEQLKFPSDQRDLFHKDQYGYQVVHFWVDKELPQWNKIEVDKFDDTLRTLSVLVPLLGEDSSGFIRRFNIKFPKEMLNTKSNPEGKISLGSKIIARGKGYYKYKPFDSKLTKEIVLDNTYNKEKERLDKKDKGWSFYESSFIKVMGVLNNAKYNNIREIPTSEYERYINFTVTQILEAK